MTERQTQVLPPDAAGLDRAAGLLRAGGLVAFPTETVYGLGADARNDRAVAGIYEAKGRPSFNPLIVHLAEVAEVERYCLLSPEARRLADQFWPGPLTLVLPLKPSAGISRLVTAGLETLAVRVPAHPVAQGLLRAFGGPVAAPSANPSGRISPTRAAHVLEGLRGRIDAVVDGGACGVGLESTILGFPDGPVLYRAGGVPLEEVEAALGQPVRAELEAGENPSAPGQLQSHYAPSGRVRLNAARAEPGEILLGFGPVSGARLNLSPTGDLTEAAARLFDCLHQLDAMGARAIAVSPIPMQGLGLAINDRLSRAAAPR